MQDNLTMDFFDIEADDLRNNEYCMFLLNRIIEDYDSRLMLSTIKDIAKARGIKMDDLAKASGLSRRVVYHTLSPKGNPSLSTLLSLLKAFGIRLRFEIVSQETA